VRAGDRDLPNHPNTVHARLPRCTCTDCGDFDLLSSDDPINDDETLGETNVATVVNCVLNDLLANYLNAYPQAAGDAHILATFGDDFRYQVRWGVRLGGERGNVGGAVVCVT